MIHINLCDVIEFHDDGTATITKNSIISHGRHTLTMKLTKEQYDSWSDGTLIQEAMPHLTPAEREFLMSGITPEEWEKEFKDDE